MVARSAPLAALVAALWFGFQAVPAAAQGMRSSDALALRGAGSTFASLLYKKWIEAYRAAAPAVSISYDPVGSGEGIARFMAETVDFAGSDVPLSEAEIAKVRNGVAMMPTLAGMIVLAYNVPGAPLFAGLLIALCMIVIAPYAAPLTKVLLLAQADRMPAEPSTFLTRWRYAPLAKVVILAILISVRVSDGLCATAVVLWSRPCRLWHVRRGPLYPRWPADHALGR